ncbi:hypothetical protein [Candidatus Palauibacter sp.]|uniref:hypothetical protein n=1 Tax=Candidatus Palauibacter sp. TaxID=3101350 RepID=UPI003B58E602
MSRTHSVANALRAYVQGRDRVWEHGRKLGPTASPSEDIEFGSLPAPPRFGVAVAEDLDFRRGPAAWWDRAPRAEE